MSILSENLKKARKGKQMTQTEAAERIGVSRPSLGAYEEGRAVPPVDVFFKICAAYNIKDMQRFFCNQDYDSPTKTKSFAEMLEDKYFRSKGEKRQAVDVLLGIK